MERPHPPRKKISRIQNPQIQLQIQLLQTSTDEVTPISLDAKRTPDWMNAHHDISFTDLEMTTFDEIEGFLKIHGQQLECLNLGSFACNNDEFKKLVDHCPQLKVLFVSSNNITNCALSNLKDKPLKSISCKGSEKLTHKALKHIKELATTLTSVDFTAVKSLPILQLSI